MIGVADVALSGHAPVIVKPVSQKTTVNRTITAQSASRDSNFIVTVRIASGTIVPLAIVAPLADLAL